MTVTKPALPIAPTAHWSHTGEREHFVQFYEDEAVILEAVNGFVRRGLSAGAAGIVIATRAHLDELERQWTTQGLDVAGARDRGQYIPLEAAETLSRVLVDGWPGARSFAQVIEPVVEAAARRYPRVVAFGEMVALLWDEGRHGAAVELEYLWNELAEKHSFALFCAYRMRGGADTPSEALRKVCSEHARAIPSEGYTGLASSADRLAEICELQHKARCFEQELQLRKAIERVLAAREHELTDFLENAPQAMQSVGPDGRILWANQAALVLLGYGPEEYVGRSLDEVFVDTEQIAGTLRRLLAGETLRDEPVCLRCKDGRLKHVLVDSNASWEDGVFVRNRCFLRDVTGANEAEQLRALMAAIVESSDDAIVSKSLDGRITSWNSGARRLFGFTAEEMIGKPVTTIIPPELQGEEAVILDKLRKGERIDHYETVRVAKDGRRLAVSLTVSPVRGSGGNVIGASKVVRDITDRKRAEEQLRDAARRKDEFLAMLGHELRNPLAPIRNITEVLRQTAGENVALEQMCRVLDRQVGHMTRLLDDLLDVSRITQGKIQFQREPVDFLAVVARAVETSRPLIDARRHRLTVVLPERALRVIGDLDRLVQAVANLLNNAAKYTLEGGEIKLGVEARDGTIELHVRDSGVGMTADLLPRVFEMFVQADRTLERSQGGLGIGLTLVRSIVERHGGRVEAISAGPGQGSEFIVRLPLLEDTRLPVLGGTRPDPATTRAAGTKRVLIVDDNRDSRESMAVLLRLNGHEVTVVADAPAALAAERSLQPDLVLLDIGLPGINGYDLARRLRASGCSATLAAVTGFGQAEDRKRSSEAGIDHHFVKPVDPAAVYRLLA